jgi:uncharacterized protein CbrC (UPF0167 family)
MTPTQDSEPFPSFKYHPDPVATGSIAAEPDMPCLGCNRIRGYIYKGPVFTEKNFILDDHLCPWCIADGTAAKLFSATFNYTGTIDGLSEEIRNEVEARTPGFDAWQQEEWLGCCNDAAMFLGVVGAKELKRDFPEAEKPVKKYLRDEFDLETDEANEMFDALSKADQPSAYLFRCLHCQKFLAYVDQT